MRLLSLVPGLAVLAGPAYAELVFCNETAVKASVAIGYVDDGVWTSEGWWGVQPFDCTTVVSGDLSKRYYYWRATNTHGAFDTENYAFCTTSKAFTIAGDENCEDRGYRREKFSESDTNNAKSWTITLTEAAAPAGTSDEESNGMASGHAQDATPGPSGGGGTADPDPAAHMRHDFLAEPGTHGEPYSIRAWFDHCTYQGDDLLCTFTADTGWRYVASTADPTDPIFFGDFQFLPSGAMVDLSGDMISYAGDTAQITIREWALAPEEGMETTDSDPFAAPASDLSGLQEFLQGYWMSDDDSAYYWIVQGNQLDEIYDGNLMQRSFFELAPSCSASYGQGPVIIAWPDPDEGDGPTCYLVTETGPRSLGLANVIVGRDLSFTYSN
ncbi:MAG: DUF1036 domain-containing protein [Pelagimonas sp.]|jgi:uncharacterized membrane protein|nr:DUF1036 domain-containing protein [Pelagimonas sp.]